MRTRTHPIYVWPPMPHFLGIAPFHALQPVSHSETACIVRQQIIFRNVTQCFAWRISYSKSLFININRQLLYILTALLRCIKARTISASGFLQPNCPESGLTNGAFMTARELDAQRLQKEWNESGRWRGIKRGYGPEDVVRLRGSVQVEHTLAKRGAEKLWRLLNSEAYVNTLGALTGNQAMQQVKAGLKAIYLSGWQVAGDANLAGEMYPDQSLYPVNSVPAVVRRINNTFARADRS